MKGLAVFYKPKTWTSFDVVNFLKNKLNEPHIGHAGSLDPNAQGVLLIGVGRIAAQSLWQITRDSQKEYIATVLLGSQSDTYDITGKIIENNIARFPDLNEVKNTLEKFKGKIQQIPPKFSAIKIAGTPAYKLARNNQEFKIKPKTVELYGYEILNYEVKPDSAILKMRLVVSSGFYVRSLANDLGLMLKTGGLLQDLIRTRIGSFNINEAIDANSFPEVNLEFYFKANGLVQGIGFRNYARMLAKKLNITGMVQNINSNEIEIIAQGQVNNLQKFLDKISKGAPMAKIKNTFFYFRKPQKIYSTFEKH